MRTRLAVAATALLLAVAGCTAGNDPQEPGPSTTGPSGSGVLETAPPPDAEPVAEPVEFDVTSPFSVPTSEVSVDNGATARAHLVGVYVGDHASDGDPRYQRISFYFRGDYPAYRFGYVPAIVQDATGSAVAIEGRYFLNVVFTGAQAHDDATGSSTVVQRPDRPVGMSRLVDYAPAGDFEGQVTYGIGVAAGQDGPPRIEAGQLKREDGTGGFFYVVYFDVYAAV